jgi:hypothetical protein
VHTGADVEPQLWHQGRDRQGTADGSRGRIERREESVTGGVDLPPSEPAQLAPDQLVVLLKEIVPPSVAELRRKAGRIDDVGEEHSRQVSIGPARRSFHGRKFAAPMTSTQCNMEPEGAAGA